MRSAALLIPVFLITSHLFGGNPQQPNYKTVAMAQNVAAWTKAAKPIVPGSDQTLIGFYPIDHRGYQLIRKISNEPTPLFEFSWYNNQNVFQSKIRIKLPDGYSLPQVIPAAEDKQAISVNVDDALLTRWDDQGSELGRFPLIEPYPFNSENILLTQATPDLSIILNGLTIFPAAAIQSRLIARTLDNKIIFQKSFPGATVRSIGLAPTGHFFAICIYYQNPLRFRSILLDSSGSILFEKGQRTRKILFDDTEQKVAIFDKNAVTLVDLVTRRQTGMARISQPGRIIIAATFTEQGQLALQTATIAANADNLFPWIYKHNRLLSLSERGKILQDVILDDIEVLSPSLWFRDGHLYIGHTSGLLEMGPPSAD